MKVPRIIKEGLVIASKGGFSVLVLVTKRQMRPVHKYISGLNLYIPVEVILRCPCGRYPEHCKCSEDELRSYWKENKRLLDADIIIDGLGSKLATRLNSHGGLSPGLFTEDASDMSSLLMNWGKLTLSEFHRVKEIAGVIASLSRMENETGIALIDDAHILEATSFLKMRTRIENLGYRYLNRNINLIKDG